jgi:hypothetical protein
VTTKGCDPLAWGCALSVAVTVKVKVPAIVGVPDSMPSGESVRPPGKVPVVTAQVHGDGEPALATANVNPG